VKSAPRNHKLFSMQSYPLNKNQYIFR